METNVNYTIVGAFVLILFTAIILGIIWLSAGLSGETYTIYKVYMKESVSGLTIDGAVEFNGVNVGTVKSIEISKKDPQLVELLLKVKSGTPVSQGTRAMVNTHMLSGVGYISLQDKGTDRRALPILAGETYPVISTSPSLFLRIDTALGQFSADFRRISQSIESILNKENQRAIREILLNLTNITQQLTPLLQSGFSTVQTVSTQTIPAVNQTLSNVDAVARNLISVTTDLKQNPAVIIRGRTPNPLGPGEK